MTVRTALPGRVLGPQEAHRGSLVFGAGGCTGGAAVASGRLAVPHGEQPVDETDEDFAARRAGVWAGGGRVGLMEVGFKSGQTPPGRPEVSEEDLTKARDHHGCAEQYFGDLRESRRATLFAIKALDTVAGLEPTPPATPWTTASTSS